MTITYITPHGTSHSRVVDALEEMCARQGPYLDSCGSCPLSSIDIEMSCSEYFEKHQREAIKLFGIIEAQTASLADSGNRTPMGDTGFVRDARAGKGRMDLLPWNAILDLSKHCEAGALKYGERNIDKGAPLHSLLDSGARHLAKYIAGQQDEGHLVAACWNLMWALEQRTTHPELNDMPWAKKEGA